jgi:hypothetical protein
MKSRPNVVLGGIDDDCRWGVSGCPRRPIARFGGRARVISSEKNAGWNKKMII